MSLLSEWSLRAVPTKTNPLIKRSYLRLSTRAWHHRQPPLLHRTINFKLLSTEDQPQMSGERVFLFATAAEQSGIDNNYHRGCQMASLKGVFSERFSFSSCVVFKVGKTPFSTFLSRPGTSRGSRGQILNSAPSSSRFIVFISFPGWGFFPRRATFQFGKFLHLPPSASFLS